MIIGRFSYSAQCDVPSLPIRQSSIVANTIAGPSLEPRFNYFCSVTDLSDSEHEYFRVEFALVPTNAAVPLRASADRIAFQSLEGVGSDRDPFVGDGGISNLGLTAFDQSRFWLSVNVKYFDVYANAAADSFYYRARGLTNVFVGYRFTDNDGSHYGWVQFARSVAAFTNIFDLVAHDWNPIPGAEIRAGAPPEIPLVTEVVDDGAGGSVLRTSWDPGVASWIFETTDSLEPPVTWTEYPAGGTSAEIPLDGSDSQRYFRLRRP